MDVCVYSHAWCPVYIDTYRNKTRYYNRNIQYGKTKHTHTHTNNHIHIYTGDPKPGLFCILICYSTCARCHVCAQPCWCIYVPYLLIRRLRPPIYRWYMDYFQIAIEDQDTYVVAYTNAISGTSLTCCIHQVAWRVTVCTCAAYMQWCFPVRNNAVHFKGLFAQRRQLHVMLWSLIQPLPVWRKARWRVDRRRILYWNAVC